MCVCVIKLGIRKGQFIHISVFYSFSQTITFDQTFFFEMLILSTIFRIFENLIELCDNVSLIGLILTCTSVHADGHHRQLVNGTNGYISYIETHSLILRLTHNVANYLLDKRTV